MPLEDLVVLGLNNLDYIANRETLYEQGRCERLVATGLNFREWQTFHGNWRPPVNRLQPKRQ
jgi:hypothetical protein